jgi:hypothetical protein
MKNQHSQSYATYSAEKITKPKNSGKNEIKATKTVTGGDLRQGGKK